MLPQNELLRYLRQTPMFADIELPPDSNRGVIQTDNIPLVWSHLDYFSASYDDRPSRRKHGGYALPVPNDWFSLDYQIPGIGRYSRGYRMTPCGAFYWSETSKKGGSFVVFAGDDMLTVRSLLDKSGEEFLARMRAMARNVTRLDFCTNIDAGHPDELLREWKAGRVKAYGKKPWKVENFEDQPGYTLYFGKPTSDKMLRCYDKAAALQLQGGVWTRIELQITGKPAEGIVTDMCSKGVKVVGKQAIRDFVKAPKLRWWQDALDGDEVELLLTPGKQTDFMKWLHQQVGPAILKRYRADEHREEIASWVQSVVQSLQGMAE